MAKKKLHRRRAGHKAGNTIPTSVQDVPTFSFPVYDPRREGIKENAFNFSIDGDHIIFRFVVPDLARIKAVGGLGKEQVLRFLEDEYTDARYLFHKDILNETSFDVGRATPSVMLEVRIDRTSREILGRNISRVSFQPSEVIEFKDAEKIFSDPSHPLYLDMQLAGNVLCYFERWSPQIVDLIHNADSPLEEQQIRQVVTMASLLANWQAGVCLSEHKDTHAAVYSANARPQWLKDQNLVPSDLRIGTAGRYFHFDPVPHGRLGLDVYTVWSRPLRDPVALVNTMQLSTLAAGRQAYTWQNIAEFVNAWNWVNGKDVSPHQHVLDYQQTDRDYFRGMSLGDLAGLYKLLCNDVRENPTLALVVQEKLKPGNNLTDKQKQEWQDFVATVLFVSVGEEKKGRVARVQAAIRELLKTNADLARYCLRNAHKKGAPWKFGSFDWLEGEGGKVAVRFGEKNIISFLPGKKILHRPGYSSNDMEHDLALEILLDWQSVQRKLMPEIAFSTPAGCQHFSFELDPKDIPDRSLLDKVFETTPFIDGWIITVYEDIANKGVASLIRYLPSVASLEYDFWANLECGWAPNVEGAFGNLQKVFEENSMQHQLEKICKRIAASSCAVDLRAKDLESNDLVVRAHSVLSQNGLVATRAIFGAMRTAATPNIVMMLHRGCKKFMCIFEFKMESGEILHFESTVDSKTLNIEAQKNLDYGIARQILDYFGGQESDLSADRQRGGVSSHLPERRSGLSRGLDAGPSS